jgi:hypothetical protein
MKIGEIIRLLEQDGLGTQAHGWIAPALLRPTQAWAGYCRRQTGAPGPADAASVTILDPAAA